MYNEIYQALCDILFKRGEEGYEYLDETTDIAKILEINLNFDALQQMHQLKILELHMLNILCIKGKLQR